METPIRRAVRRALHPRLRPKFDSLDFVQIVWKSFFRERDKLDRFEHPQDLALFLVGLARNKVLMEARRLTADRHDVRREQGGDLPDRTELERLARSMPSAPGHGHRPRTVGPHVARAAGRIIAELLQMRLQGHTYEEIGVVLHLDKGMVCRILQQLLSKTPS